MAFQRWSLDKLLMCIGGAALLLAFLPIGFYIVHGVLVHDEQALEKEGMRTVSVMAHEIADPMLVNDWLTVYALLQRAARASEDLLYLCVETPDRGVVSHTFTGGFPLALRELWKEGGGQTVRFRTENDSVVDVSTPVLTPELGTLHIGLSRAHLVRERRRRLKLSSTEKRKVDCTRARLLL